jgi:ribosome biogenesis protein ERB1
LTTTNDLRGQFSYFDTATKIIMGRRILQQPEKEEEEEEPPSAEESDDEEEDSEGDEDNSEGEGEEEDSVYDSEEGFEDQGSSSDEDDANQGEEKDASDDDDDNHNESVLIQYENQPRNWATSSAGRKHPTTTSSLRTDGGAVAADSAAAAATMHTDDWSSDDDDVDGRHNRIGRVPLHWYDEYDHIGYDAHGTKVGKSVSSSDNNDRLDQALAMAENRQQGKFVVHDALNDTNVTLTARQLELIRRVQGGAYAHPEFDANPDYIDYYSGVDKQISGLNTNRDPPKARFQPSQWERLKVEQMLQSLARGDINMDYLTGKIRDMNDVHRGGSTNDLKNQLFALWKAGDEEEDEMRKKGPQHIAAPKLAPPSHAASYRPPPEYLPTPDELEQWAQMEVKDRPHGSLIPKLFDNLRSVGAYEHSVREAFERCLDLYLCPRAVQKRLNIDPESLVPQLPQAADLRPFPTAKCILYETPVNHENVTPMIRCIAASPDGQFLASGASDGFVRLWEVQTGRLLRSWDLHTLLLPHALRDNNSNNDDPNAAIAVPTIKPVVSLQWNPSHAILLAAIGTFTVIIAPGTAGPNDAEITTALLQAAMDGGAMKNNPDGGRASKAVTWIPIKNNNIHETPITATNQPAGPVCALRTLRDVADCRWQIKGDYFCTVSPKAGAAAVLVHQLSKGHSQQPFSKAKGESQLACFHPNKPFLFVASQQHVRIYHLVKQALVKRLITGCRWISSMDVHHSGDHLIIGSLDRRVLWFDLDLSSSPYKTLKYHERAVRSCRFSRRYPLMASASDDGVVHVFHSMVYNDLMKNPLIVPVKILRGHEVSNNNNSKLGVLACCWHATQPWLFTAGADGKIFLYQDI